VNNNESPRRNRNRNRRRNRHNFNQENLENNLEVTKATETIKDDDINENHFKSVEEIISEEVITKDLNQEPVAFEETMINNQVLNPMNDFEVVKEPKEEINNYSEEPKTTSGFSSFHFSLGTRVALSLLIQLLLIASGVIFLALASNNMIVHNFLYNETSKLDYQVCYIENDFFPEECIPSGRQYVANLINHVDMNFNYQFNGSDLFDFTYTYSVVATTIANERGQAERILFDREDVLLAERTVQVNRETGFIIDEDIRVDYRYFNNIINNFRREYVLLLDSQIIVTLNIRVDGVHPDIADPIQVNRDITFEIPLSEQTLDVRMIHEDINSSYVMHSENENELLSMIYYALAILSFLIAFFLVIRLIKLILKTSSSKTLYKKKLDKIIREYGLVIVQTKSVPEISDQKLFEITSIEELLDVQNVLQKPIMHIRIHDEKSCFMIMNNEEAYRYVMKATDIEKEQEKK